MSQSKAILDASEAIVGILESLKIPYALGGAVAMGLLGYLRATRDIDLLVLLPALRYQEIADALNARGFCAHDAHDLPASVEVPPLVQSTRDVGQFRVWWQDVKVEVFVPKVPLQDSILKRKIRMDLGGFAVWVTTAEDLILLKMVFHRDKDLVDVRRLIAANRDTLDRAYIDEWVAKTLSAQAGQELREMMRAAGTSR